MNAVILGHEPAKCDGIYPRTTDGRCQGCGVVGEHPRKKYAQPKLTEYPMSGKIHKAAIEAAKCEARVELLEQVIEQILSTGQDRPWDHLEVFRAWQESYEADKRKALDAFVLLVQEKLRAETAQRL